MRPDGTGGSKTWGVGAVPARLGTRFVEGTAYCARFFMGEGDAQKALFRLTAILESEGIPYAIIGGFALNAYRSRNSGKRRRPPRIDMDTPLLRQGA